VGVWWTPLRLGQHSRILQAFSITRSYWESIMTTI